MKIMSYNILVGGVDKKESRIKEIIKVIKAQSPDFLALQETENFEKDKNKILKRFSKELNLPYYSNSISGAVKGGNPYHVASLSRYPFIESNIFSKVLFGGAAISTLIKTPLGNISFCNIHLNSGSMDHRIKELAIILKHQSKFKKQIILGDHNALSKSDKYSSKDKHTYFEAMELLSKKYIDAAFFEAMELLSKKYIDTALYLHENNMRTYPTKGTDDSDDAVRVRLDYISVTKPLVSNVKKVEVINTFDSDIASDHYPVTLILE